MNDDGVEINDDTLHMSAFARTCRQMIRPNKTTTEHLCSLVATPIRGCCTQTSLALSYQMLYQEEFGAKE